MTTQTPQFKLPKSFDPAEVELRIRTAWDEAGIFHWSGATDAPPFSIVIPPPNVTAPLHLGHALNNTLQDVLTRYHRMRGDQTIWIPGTDHAGIATQTVVEKRLIAQGKRRTDFTREAFVAMVQEWKEEYEATILSQLKQTGASCDWARARFTMDEVCEQAVLAAFFRLFSEDLIYRGKRLVNWDPVTQTALSDDEVEMEDVAGHMYYFRYPLEDGSETITIATTRPETMLGDTAVAINPDDPRAAALRGKFITLPIVGRRIPIVEDDFVVMPGMGDDPKAAFATGFLKVTPAHDPNDWEIGRRHDLEAINIMAPDGSISREHGWDDDLGDAGWLIGMSREDAREAVVAWFTEHELLEEIRDYDHAVGHSYRSHAAIEPYLSDQWYVRVTDDALRGEALRAMDTTQHDGDPPPRSTGPADGDGGLTFHPPRYAKTFQTWHENLRDWCISRQLWWGHQIPVFSGIADETVVQQCSKWHDEGHAATQAGDEGITYVCLRDPSGEDQQKSEWLLEHGFQRDPDVLDTWFSSALWPISTMGWPDPERFQETEGLLETFNPTTVVCTGRDIITLWVSRMVMFNRYFRESVLPFGDVYIHPMVQDGHGQRMSKSLGNGVDPRDIIDSNGADALRFALMQIATQTQDVRLPVDLIDPHSGQTFTPEFITSPAGYRVPAPIQTSPVDAEKTMVTAYGVSTGEVEPSDHQPLARNSSPRFNTGRHFANKIWNAARFALSNVTSPEPVIDFSSLQVQDQWMLRKLAAATTAIEEAFASYQFNAAADVLYDIIWRDFCDWYLEAIKHTVRDDPKQQQVLLTVLDVLLRLAHPICPFVTETLWPAVQHAGRSGVAGVTCPPAPLLAGGDWPDVEPPEGTGADLFEQARAIITAIRRVRSDNAVGQRRMITLLADDATAQVISLANGVVEAMAGLESVLPLSESTAQDVAVGDGECRLRGLTDEVDPAQRRGAAQDAVEECRKKVVALQARMENPAYVERAPAHLVQETRDQLSHALEALATSEEALEACSDE